MQSWWHMIFTQTSWLEIRAGQSLSQLVLEAACVMVFHRRRASCGVHVGGGGKEGGRCSAEEGLPAGTGGHPPHGPCRCQEAPPGASQGELP